MTKRTSLMSRVMVFILAIAVVFAYSVVPMNQAYAAAKSKKPAKVSGLKATAVSSSSVKLTWKKAKNAKKYQIYVSTNSKKGFKRVATVKASKRTYTVKKFNKKALKANKKYYFKVRAGNGKKYGKFSKIVSKKTLKKSAVPAIPDRQVFVDADYVKALVDSGASNVVIAEVSWGPMEYAPDYLIKGAIHVNTDDLESNQQDLGYEFWDLRGFNNNYKELIEALGSYGITTDTELICYGADPAGSAQTRLAMAALMMGVKKVRVLDGGVAAWGDKGYPMVKKEEAAAPKAASFGRTEPLHPDWVISTADMLKKVQSDSNFKLVSIRSYDEFIGTNSGYAYISKAGEPEGAVWGHDTDDSSYFINGKTVDTDKIDEYLKPYGASTKNELAFYCGTGWRATIPFLICYEEGIDNMKLWDDGWYVYSGAYADEWNGGDGTAKAGIDFNSHPVQVGDPAKGDVVKTTVKDLPATYNRLRGLSVKEETVTADKTGVMDSNFEVMPDKKKGILDSVSFTSSDESVATVDAEGKVTVVDVSKPATVTIKAESKATWNSKPEFSAEYKLVIESAADVDYVTMRSESADKWKEAGIDFDAVTDDDFILDVRPDDPWKAGHIEGATHINVAVSDETLVKDGYVVDGSKLTSDLDAAYAGANGKRIVVICMKGQTLAARTLQYFNAKSFGSEGVDPAKVTYLIGGADSIPADKMVK